jgi:hypothetical protein
VLLTLVSNHQTSAFGGDDDDVERKLRGKLSPSVMNLKVFLLFFQGLLKVQGPKKFTLPQKGKLKALKLFDSLLN